MPRRRLTRLYELSADELSLYYDSNSAREIGEQFGASTSSVRRRLKELGIGKFHAPEYTPEEEQFMQSELDQITKRKIIDGFKEWASTHMAGWPKSGQSILNSLENSDINYEGNGNWQINNLSTDRVLLRDTDRHESTKPEYRIQEGDIKIRFDQSQNSLEIYIKNSKGYKKSV